MPLNVNQYIFIRTFPLWYDLHYDGNNILIYFHDTRTAAQGRDYMRLSQ